MSMKMVGNTFTGARHPQMFYNQPPRHAVHLVHLSLGGKMMKSHMKRYEIT